MSTATSNDFSSANARAAVDAAITSRRSVRAFLPTPVPLDTVRELLAIASRAPSGTNIQPWLVHVLIGSAKERLSADILRVFDDPVELTKHESEFPIYPNQWVSPYIDRRRKVGWDLYASVGIQKGDRAGTHAHHARNFRFFDAPVGIIFTIDRNLGSASWIDYGIFMGNFMTAARARGLHTCPQLAFPQFHRVIRSSLGLPDNELVLCGMSLGFEDTSAPENSLRTERAPLEQWATFHS
jgi:nitroreductase